jgi:hypothetical protein
LDDDDNWHSSKLYKQYKHFIEHSDVGLVYCGFRYIDFDSKKIIKTIRPHYNGNVLNKIIRNNIMGSPTPLIRRECFNNVGLFDEELRSCQDWDMWIRLAQKVTFGYVDEVLADVTLHGQQISVNLESKIESREKLMEKYHLYLKQRPCIFAYHLRKMGVLHSLNHSPVKAFLCFIRSLANNPLNIICVTHILFSVFPPLHRHLINRYGNYKYGGISIYN